jgi:hypothetical protein
MALEYLKGLHAAITTCFTLVCSTISQDIRKVFQDQLMLHRIPAQLANSRCKRWIDVHTNVPPPRPQGATMVWHELWDVGQHNHTRAPQVPALAASC